MHPGIPGFPCWGFAPAPYSSDKAGCLEYPWRRQPDSSLLGPNGWRITAGGWAIARNGSSIGPSGTIVELATILRNLPVDNPGYVDPKRWWIQADGSATREDGWVIGSDGQASCTSGEILNPDEGTLDTEIFNEIEPASEFFQDIASRMETQGARSLLKIYRICQIEHPVTDPVTDQTPPLFVGNIPTDVRGISLKRLIGSLFGSSLSKGVDIHRQPSCALVNGLTPEEIEWLKRFNHRILLNPNRQEEYAVFTGKDPQNTLAALIANTRNFFLYYPRNPLVIEESRFSAIREDGQVILPNGEAVPFTAALDQKICDILGPPIENGEHSAFLKHIIQKMQRLGIPPSLHIYSTKPGSPQPITRVDAEKTAGESLSTLFIGNIPTNVSWKMLQNVLESLLPDPLKGNMSFKKFERNRCGVVHGLTETVVDFLVKHFNHRVVLDPNYRDEYALFSGENPRKALTELLAAVNSSTFFPHYPQNPLVIERARKKS